MSAPTLDGKGDQAPDNARSVTRFSRCSSMNAGIVISWRVDDVGIIACNVIQGSKERQSLDVI